MSSGEFFFDLLVCTKGKIWLTHACEIKTQGTFLDTTGNDDISDCISCPPGTYSNSMGNTKWNDCQPCSDGQYSSVDGSGQCKFCPKGSSTAVVAGGTVVYASSR